MSKLLPKLENKSQYFSVFANYDWQPSIREITRHHRLKVTEFVPERLQVALQNFGMPKYKFRHEPKDRVVDIAVLGSDSFYS